MVYKNMSLYNVAEVVETDGGIILTRIPEGLRVSLNDAAKTRAVMPAGCEMRFNLKSKEARILLKGNEGERGIAEVYQGNFLLSYHFVADSIYEIRVSLPKNIEKLKEISSEKSLPFDAGLTRVVLPHIVTLKVIDIEGDFAPAREEQSPSKRYLTYGSSITHGQASIRPTGSYAMRTAEYLGVDLINLGFGGGAHCEKQMADYIADRQDWDFASLELGINMVGGFEVEEFRKRVKYFIPRITEAHPDKYIFCIDMFTFYMDYDRSAEKQNTFRKIVKDVVKDIGSKKVIHIDGRDILRSINGLAVDLVHPSPAGMEEMAMNLSSIIKNYIS
jgi:lysophospholipase L1-like esterase